MAQGGSDIDTLGRNGRSGEMRSNAERAAECAPTRFSLACRGKPPKNYTKPRPKRKRRPREGPPWEEGDWERGLETPVDREGEGPTKGIVDHRELRELGSPRHVVGNEANREMIIPIIGRPIIECVVRRETEKD